MWVANQGLGVVGAAAVELAGAAELTLGTGGGCEIEYRAPPRDRATERYMRYIIARAVDGTQEELPLIVTLYFPSKEFI
jgi:hypothetical protein